MRKIYAIAIITASIMAASCTRTDIGDVTSGEGSISLGVSIDGTKAAMSDEQLLNTASVKIYMADFSGLIREYTYGSAPSVIYLPADSYRIDVLAGEASKTAPAAASWEQKSYAGSTAFTVIPGVNTPVTVNAGVSNVITKVTFDGSVAENFNSGYTFTIGLSDSDAAQQLVYDASKSGSEGYFLPSGFEPSLYWTFSGVLAKDGSTFYKSGTIASVEGGKIYTMAPKFTVREGDLTFELNVDYSVDVISDIVVFEPVSTGLSKSQKYEIWAGHATVHADVDETEYSDPSAIKFAYSGNGTDWTTVNATRDSEGVYSALIQGLSGSTEYSYKLVIDGEDVGDPMTITTSEARQLPNWDFETTSNAESSKWTSFYDPESSDSELKTKFWDSGSSASAGMLGSSYAICYWDSDVPAGIGSTKSARLQSLGAAGKLAAGNLFTGEFAGLDGLNGKVNFGRPWGGCRPTKVRFWYKYIGGKVDKTASGAPITTSDYDMFEVKVALGNWSNKTYGGSTDCPVQVNTNKTSTFWNYPDLPETIAYASLSEVGNGGTSEWKQVTLDLTYYSETEFPQFIIVSGAASKYGDYFAGSTSSALWLDNFELIYE